MIFYDVELDLEWGQIPVLEIDGVRKSQSFAIARYLAKKYNLAGNNEAEEFRCDEIVEAIRDFVTSNTLLRSFVHFHHFHHFFV